MDELVADFISEASESLLNLDNEIVELEINPENDELLGKIFRVMHTIKGTCGFLSLDKLASVAHAGENILDQMRSKKIPINSENISIIFESIDVIKSIVNYIQSNGKEPETDYSDLINKINSSINEEKSTSSEIKQEASDDSKILDKENQEETQASSPVLDQEEHKDAIESPVKKEDAQIPTAPSQENNENQTVRVKIKRLEELMQTVSELVLNRNQLLQLDRSIRSNELSSALQDLNTLTATIQETVMKTRMQPISNAWIKMPRLVRDLSNDLNKKIKLVMIGQETELDKQLIEAIKDPLIHMVRNSADHGLEKEEDRLAAGKPAEGTITLKAYYVSGHIVIEVSDDGYGINIDRVKSKILENSLATEKDLELLSDQQIIQYVFRAGFSTAAAVTSVSGRGVGMDVVKNNIDKIRGSVELQSITGKGSTFIIKIPLTLAIMPILIVESQEQRFGIPQVNILEMILVNEADEYQIEEVNGHKILRLREDLLPLVTLSEVLQLKESKETEECYIIICNINNINFALVVDDIHDTEEIVLKPISPVLKSIKIYSGITVLGNGDVITILDLNGIAEQVSLTHAKMVETGIEKEEDEEENIPSSFLLVKVAEGFKAIPLELVSRLEEIDLAKLENVRGKKVIQYHNALMYIELLDPDYQIPNKGKQLVIVLENDEHIIGLVVENIVEIVKQNIEDNINSSLDNVSTLVLDGKTADIIDVSGCFDKLFFVPMEEVNFKNSEYKILLVEDSPYFRKLISSLLKSEGFNVFSAKNGPEALGLIKEEKSNFDLLITDFDMPDMDGLELAKQCKENSKSKNIPIISLVSTVKLSKKEKKEASEIIKEFIPKSNHSELIMAIDSLLEGA